MATLQLSVTMLIVSFKAIIAVPVLKAEAQSLKKCTLWNVERARSRPPCDISTQADSDQRTGNAFSPEFSHLLLCNLFVST